MSGLKGIFEMLQAIKLHSLAYLCSAAAEAAAARQPEGLLGGRRRVGAGVPHPERHLREIRRFLGREISRSPRGQPDRHLPSRRPDDDAMGGEHF